MTKGIIRRPRPLLYNPNVPFEKKNKKGARLSFFSGHTSGVATLSFLSAKFFADYYPDSKWKPVVWTAAALLPSTTGYLRYKAGKHFKTDVMMGAAIGACVGILIPHLHKKKEREGTLDLSLLTEGDKLGFVLRW